VQYSAAMAGERPSGTVTFLFTEVEDSTERSEGAAADMAAAFQVHDAMVRDAIESQSGYVFAADGDCFSAVFSTATDAVTAAVAAQQVLARGRHPVRGRDGLTSLAHGGQVVA